MTDDTERDQRVPQAPPAPTIHQAPTTTTITLSVSVELGELDPEVVRLLLERVVGCEMIRMRAFHEVAAFDVLSTFDGRVAP